MLGVLVSWPLRGLFSGLWDKKAVKRLFGISFGIILASALWTVSRIVSFMAMTGEREIWLDFGGWIWGSIIIFIGWGSLYHGTKYYQLWLSERKELGESVEKIERFGYRGPEPSYGPKCSAKNVTIST